MAQTEDLSQLQRKLVGHGLLQIFCTLLFGVGYWWKLVGGIEIIPGKIAKFNVPGTEEGWKRAHTGPAMNGLMVIGTAASLPYIDLEAKTTKRLAWIVALDGWSNVIFYFFGNFAPSRGLSFGRNKHGKSNLWGVIALGPAYLFGVLGLWALGKLGWSALKSKNTITEPAALPTDTSVTQPQNGQTALVKS